LGARLSQEFVPAHASKPGVGDDHEHLVGRKQLQRFLSGFRGPDLISLLGENRLEGSAHVFLVINDEHWWKHTHLRL
jgi:hypothetical protein